jgi:hypothetical protein
LVQAFQIGQPQGFQPVQRDGDLLEIGHRHALRLEGVPAKTSRDPTRRLGSWHRYLVMIICSQCRIVNPLAW